MCPSANGRFVLTCCRGQDLSKLAKQHCMGLENVGEL